MTPHSLSAQMLAEGIPQVSIDWFLGEMKSRDTTTSKDFNKVAAAVGAEKVDDDDDDDGGKSNENSSGVQFQSPTPIRPPPPIIFTFNSPSAPPSTLPLYAAAFLPDATRFGPGPYPTLVSVYGGPHVQRVKTDWSMAIDLRANALRNEGYLVVMGDGRGSSRRGLHFEAELKGCMGTVEVEDQTALVNTVIGWGLADPLRVGIYGWSYGGYLSLMCLAKAPHVFHAAVAGAPVTEWEGYDTG